MSWGLVGRRFPTRRWNESASGSESKHLNPYNRGTRKRLNHIQDNVYALPNNSRSSTEILPLCASYREPEARKLPITPSIIGPVEKYIPPSESMYDVLVIGGIPIELLGYDGDDARYSVGHRVGVKIIDIEVRPLMGIAYFIRK